jgi:hypothetical protein
MIDLDMPNHDKNHFKKLKDINPLRSSNDRQRSLEPLPPKNAPIDEIFHNSFFKSFQLQPTIINEYNT